jgi:hemolysin-activating ACP:hemolysin acyltransferase
LANAELGSQFLKSLRPELVQAAASKLVAASIGDIVVVLSRSPVHKLYSIAGIEWMAPPTVMAGQFTVAGVERSKNGSRKQWFS